MKRHYLYLMVDPITDIVRYVGQSTDPMKRKFAHFHGTTWLHNPKNDWIRALKKKGLQPKFMIVCSLDCTKEVIDYYEYRLILRFKTEHLLNERPFKKERKPLPQRLAY